MIWIFKWLLFGHIHQWKTLSDNPLHINDCDGKTISTGQRYIQQCERCGIVVKRDLA